MAQEIEAKFQLINRDEHLSLRKTLEGLNARYDGPRFERNVFYDQNGLHQSRDEVIRLREVTHRPNHFYVLTYKGKLKRGKFKTREEIECMVPASFEKFLTVLGYKRTFEFEKIRRAYHISDCEVALDTLPNPKNGERLYFCEIEGSTVAKIEYVKKMIGFANASIIKKGYPSLLKEIKNKKTIRFSP